MGGWGGGEMAIKAKLLLSLEISVSLALAQTCFDFKSGPRLPLDKDRVSFVQLGPKLNTKLGLNHHHHPSPTTRNFSMASRHSGRLRFRI